MSAKLLVTCVLVAPDDGLLERVVHAFDLSVDPRVVWLGQPVLDATFPADAIEHVHAVLRSWSVTVLRHVAELDAVVCKHSVDPVGHRLDQPPQELRDFAPSDRL